MISEHVVANGYASMWSQVTPLSGGYWKIENMLLQRAGAAVESRADKSIRAVVNETGFRAFCLMRERGGPNTKQHIVAAVRASIADSVEYILRLAPQSQITTTTFDDVCERESVELANQLLQFFPGHSTTVLRPRFAGCGVISACEGDVIEGDCLFEVKAGDRAFRISDLRQLLVYATLAHASRLLNFNKIGLYNPRTGLYWKRSLNEVCQSIAGSRPMDVLSALVLEFSSGSVSR